jgi:hypothetical protein
MLWHRYSILEMLTLEYKIPLFLLPRVEERVARESDHCMIYYGQVGQQILQISSFVTVARYMIFHQYFYRHAYIHIHMLTTLIGIII